MRMLIRLLTVAVACVSIAAGGVYLLLSNGPETARNRSRTAAGTATASAAAATPATKPEGEKLDIIREGFEDGGFGVANRFMPARSDMASLSELRDAVAQRAPRGLAALTAEREALKLDDPPTRDQALKRMTLSKEIGLLYLYEGRLDEAAAWTNRALEDSKAVAEPLPPRSRSNLVALLGIIALRRGEQDNCIGCVGPSSCIFPIVPEAAHKRQEGSREAIRQFTAYLEESPRDLRVIWLLNLAYMTLGEYPQGVPERFRIPAELFAPEAGAQSFTNVAQEAGLGARGTNLAGGSIFDDFTGDGRPDLFTTSLNVDRGASLFVNRGDGTFEDRSTSAGLDDQIYALNVTRADFNNDGHLDVLLLRGGWERPARLSLLKNRGDGTFDDVTVAAGLDTPIATEAASWGDYDNDGLIDVYVCGEYFPALAAPTANEKPSPLNHGRLYRNQGDGTFQDVAESAGVRNDRCGKGAAWGDYDADGRIDLFVSNRGQPARLYHNEGDGKFRDVAEELGVTGPSRGFACWFWDYDNDGRLDLFVNDYQAGIAEVLTSAAGTEMPGASRARLYANFGPAGFRDVSRVVGLERTLAPMGCNFADIDNDGFLDLYFGTGDMALGGLHGSRMYRNRDGRAFDDVTGPTRTGHLQKGHGVSFADYDDDGDLDLFIELGGAAPGDQAYNALFRNPGGGGNWLKVKLVGTRTNRAAIGASLRADILGADGRTRSVYRTIGTNSSFGGNSLVELIGLAEAAKVASLTIAWPTSGQTQTFRDLEAGQSIEITEGVDEVRRLP